VLNSDGSVTYTPDKGFVGTDSFRYWVEDEDGNRASALVSVTVAAPGSKPVADNENRRTTPGEPVIINVLAGDTDPDGDTLTVSTVTQPVHGIVQINADGTVTYTPDKGYQGTDTFTYTVSDGTGNIDTATVTVTVAAGAVGSLPRTGTDVVSLAQVGLLVLISGAALIVFGARPQLTGQGRHRPGRRRRTD
jgi:LPXTG-motif cell wall-anchored protein